MAGPPPLLDIRGIRDEELDDFCGVLRDAALWLIERGEELWSLEQVAPRGILGTYRIEELYLGFTESEPAAAMVLQTADPLFWPDVPAGEALFLHKLAVARRYRGTGCSTQMIQWAAAKARRLGLKFLRLDSAVDRIKLRRFYAGQGFVAVGQRQVGKYDVVLYELKLG